MDNHGGHSQRKVGPRLGDHIQGGGEAFRGAVIRPANILELDQRAGLVAMGYQQVSLFVLMEIHRHLFVLTERNITMVTKKAYKPYIIICMYSRPPLIRPPYLPRNCGHIREVAFGERENYRKRIHSSCGKNLWPH